MQSKNLHYDPRLDHLRALAALIVFFFELKFRTKWLAPSPFSIPLIDQGHIGVTLFMVLSGFLFAQIVGDKTMNVRNFYFDRILRIYPLFFAVVFAGYCAESVVHGGTRPVEFLLSLLPISNLFRDKYGALGGMLWSVAIELQFYLIFPILWTSLRQSGWRGYALLLGFLLSIRLAVYIATGTVHHFAYFTIFGCLDAFLFGCMASELRTRFGWSFPAWLPLVILGVISVTIWLLFDGDRFFHVGGSGVSQSPVWIVWPTIQAVLMATLLITYLGARSMPAMRWLAYVGKISFSIYAWQILIFYATLPVIRGLPSNAFLTSYSAGLLVLPILIAFSAMSFRLIEKPFLDMRIRYVDPPAAAEPKAGVPR